MPVLLKGGQDRLENNTSCTKSCTTSSVLGAIHWNLYIVA